MPEIDLDASDLTILNRLNEKGRATYSELADELMLTVPTVKARIEKLIKIGVIDHIGIYLNPHSLTSDVSSILSFQIMKHHVDKFLAYLQTHEEIKTVYEVLDEFNIIAITQFLPMSSHQELFEKLQARPTVKQGRIQILIKEIFSKPHQIPKKSQFLNIKCEYCGKKISDEYETIKIDDIRHYFCCTSCLKNYKDWIKDQGRK
jgi:DNA-binding Lrp family transcriptional regulator